MFPVTGKKDNREVCYITLISNENCSISQVNYQRCCQKTLSMLYLCIKISLG